MGFEEEGDAFSDDQAIGDAASILPSAETLAPMKDARETFFGLEADPPEECILPRVCFEDAEDGASSSRWGLGGRPLSVNHLLSGLTGVSSFPGAPHTGLALPLALPLAPASNSPRKNIVRPPFRVCGGALLPIGCLEAWDEHAAPAEPVRPAGNDENDGPRGTAPDRPSGRPCPPSIEGRNPTVLIGECVCSVLEDDETGADVDGTVWRTPFPTTAPWSWSSGEKPTIHKDVFFFEVYGGLLLVARPVFGGIHVAPDRGARAGGGSSRIRN